MALASVVSVAGVSLGVAALITVMSVLGGLESFIAESVTAAESPVEILPADGEGFLPEDSLLALVADLPGVRSVSPFIEGEAIVRNPGRDLETGCRIRGIDPDGAAAVPGSISYGGLELRTPDGFPCTVVGLYLAEDLYHPLGDTLLFFPPRAFFSSGGIQVGRAVLSGAVETGLPMNDRMLAYVPIELASRLFLPGGGFSGLAVALEPGVDPEGIAAAIAPMLPPSMKARTWREGNPSLAASMELERIGSFSAILLITLVATFNIVGTISRSVVERRRDISILKAMGAGRRLVLDVFLWEGMMVGAAGVASGLVLGLAMCWLVGGTGLISLPDVYSFHERIPVLVDPAVVALVCASSFGLSLLSAFLPALRASALDPLAGLRS